MRKQELFDQIISATPTELLAALERLIGKGVVSVSQATEVYATARRHRAVKEAREHLVSTSEAMTVYYLNAVGASVTEESAKQLEKVYKDFQRAIDNLILRVQQAI